MQQRQFETVGQMNSDAFNTELDPVKDPIMIKSRQTQFSSNQVLQEFKSNRRLIYLPCYVRFKVKEIISIDIEGLQGTVTGTLLFSFYYGQLSEKILHQFVGDGEKSILLQFSRQESLQLKEDKGIVVKFDQQQKIVDFVVRQDFVCNLQGDVFFTPFEIINLYLTITIQSVVLNPASNNGERIDVKFNCMSSQFVTEISHGENCRLGNYVLARRFIDSAYKNSEKMPFKEISFTNPENILPVRQQIKRQSIRQSQVVPKNKDKVLNIQDDDSHIQLVEKKKERPEKKKDDKIKNYQYTHFRIPLYKYPGASLVSIFIPLWLVGFINLLIFFQDKDLAGRIASIATLTLAFIAFIPTINAQIPQTPYLKLIQILIYMQTIASILCLIDSYAIKDLDSAIYKFQWSTDGYFIAALILNLINVLAVFVLFFVHKCYWQGQYNQYNKPQDQGKVQVLKKQHWNNIECDSYISKWYNSGKITYYKNK